jgi:diguanylate cyclase (GGDEF)-like protein
MRQIPRPEIPESDDPYELLRLQVARRDIPQAFALAGGMVIVFSAVSALVFHDRDLWIYVSELVLGVLYLVTAVVLGHRRFRGRTMMWTWALMLVLLVALLVFEALSTDNVLPLAYALVVLTAFVPVTLAWRPAVVAGVLMLLVLGFGVLRSPGLGDTPVIAVAVSCLVIGMVLLKLRLNAIDALADERARTESLATTDLLTGALTRQGLLTLLPGLAGNAYRADKQVCVIYVDIKDLQAANDSYGIGYGDDVLRVVADVLKNTVRQGDLVSRWEGDRFIVAGLGDQPDPVAMRERIEGALRLTGLALGRPPIEVWVGTAAGDPSADTFDDIMREAQTNLRATKAQRA